MRFLLFLGLLAFLFPSPAFSADDASGLPVTSELVRSACGACHETDGRGRMSRISYQRKTPEGWQITVKRMIRTGRVQAEPAHAKAIVRYLADHHGLAPSEARPTFYAAEKRPVVEKIQDKDLKATCTRCHLGARFLSQRRTPEEWQLLKGMHLGYFPIVEFQTFRGRVPGWEVGEEGGEARDSVAPAVTDKKWRVDRVLERLAKQYPFETPLWGEFLAKGSDHDLSGRWLLSTYQSGQGLVAGEVTIERSGDDYVTRAELILPNGSLERREGRAILYAGYTWRGSSHGAALGEEREVLMLSDDAQELRGRFFRGAFSELGLDVSLKRLGRDLEIAGVWPRALAAGQTATVRILGSNFPQSVEPVDLRFGPGVRVREVATRSSNRLDVSIEVDKEAPSGRRNVRVLRTTALDVFAVYDRVDYVKVRPEEGLARLGGVKIPKQVVQFEAVAFHRGPDGDPLTDDDIELVPVEVRWSLEEYHIRHDDDDLKYVGTIDETGLFTPNIEGPNPDRGGTNNFGDVWAVATYTPPGAARLLRGRAHLLVTVPLYAYWETFP
ncbi:MAG: quinohemoprotein amine dehydrogenase subunit alpha [Acidobacteriota bacterium]